MPRVKQTHHVSVALDMVGDEGRAYQLFQEYRKTMKARSIFTGAMLAYAGQQPSTFDENARRIIDATTRNVQAMLDAMKEEMLLAYGEQLIKELRNVSFVQSANNAPQRPHDAPVTDDEYDLMKRVAGTIMNRMKKAGG